MEIKKIETLFKVAVEDWKQALNNGGDLALFNELTRPQLGDLVVEKTISRFTGEIHMGFLIGSHYNRENPVHHILDIFTKKIIEYSNCELIVVRNQSIHKYPEYKI